MNKFQDDFDITLSEVDTKPLALKTELMLSVKDRKTGKKILNAERVHFDLGISGFLPVMDIEVNGADVNLTKDFLTRMMNGEDKKNKEEKQDSSNPLSYLGLIKITDLNLSLRDTTETLLSHLSSLEISFPEGSGHISGFSARLKEENLRLVDVQEIDLEFNADGILGEDSANLGASINGMRVRLAESAIEAVKKLMDFPAGEEKKKGGSPLKEISFLELRNSTFRHEDLKLAAKVGEFRLSLKRGHILLQDLWANWIHTGRKLSSVGKFTAVFSPEPLLEGGEPRVRGILTNLHVSVGKEFQDLLSQGDKKKESATSPDIPFQLISLLIGNSRVTFPGTPGVAPRKYFAVQEIFGSIKNVSMEPGTPLGTFSFNATLGGKSKLMANGEFDLAHVPFQASADYRVFDFNMKTLNPELRERLPLTIREGEFHLIGEVIKRDEDIVGYMKPFIDDASYLGNRDEFKNPQHFFLEIGATVANWLFENSDSKTVATSIPFVVKDGKVDFKAGEALWNAVEHGLLETDEVKPREKGLELRQAEEEMKDEK